MQSETGNSSPVSNALEALREEVARLNQRVAALEAAAGVRPHVPGPAPSAPEAVELSEELIVVISAAIAAFLGKRPHIRQIRLLGAAAWAQQGRVTIQASHNLAVRHG
jgi:methylmalonyl-CoA carboxyltransferase large subunit